MERLIGIQKSKVRGDITLYIEKEGKKRYIHSKYNPVREAREWALCNRKEGKTSYLIFGGGLWYHVEELLRTVDEESHVVIIEPDREIFEIAVQEKPYQSVADDSRLTVLSLEKKENYEEICMDLLQSLRLKDLVFLKWHYYDEYYTALYRATIQAVKNHILLREIDVNTTEKFAIEHMENVLSNLFYMQEGTFAMHFQNLFQGKSAIVVSAGPSLDKNIDRLKGNEDKALIISGGRTLKTLLERGIKPHFAVSIDPSYRNFMLIQDVLDESVPMVNTLLSNKEIAKNYRGEKIFLNNSGIPGVDHFFFERKIDTLAASGTVATLQMSFAEYLGCSNIALIGQDLAYTDRKFHADSASILEDEQGEGNDASVIEDSLIRVRGNKEETVLTDGLFLGYIKMMESQIRDLDEVSVYNCTEGGAFIEGTRTMDLDEFFDTKCDRENDFYSMIDEVIRKNKNDRRAFNIKEKIHELERISHRIITLTKDGIKIIARNLREGEERQKDTDKLDKIDKKISKMTSEIDFSETLVKRMLLAFEDIEIDSSKDEKERMQDIRKVTRSFYALVQGIYKSLDVFLKAQLKEIAEYEKKLKSQEN